MDGMIPPIVVHDARDRELVLAALALLRLNLLSYCLTMPLEKLQANLDRSMVLTTELRSARVGMRIPTDDEITEAIDNFFGDTDNN
jgi:hypothetical protein